MRFYLANSANTVTEIKGTVQERDNLIKRGWKIATPDQTAKYRKRFRKHNPDPIKEKNPLIGFNEKLLDVYFLCPEYNPSGYGVVSQDLTRYLLRSGVMLNREYHGQQIGFCYHYPQHLEKLQTPYKILYTMFESSKMPESWAKYLKLANEVVVPSQFCADVMQKQFNITAKVIPHGYDSEVFNQLTRDKTKSFTFLHYDAFKYRKGWDIVFNAFTKEFKDNEPVKLILKTTIPKTLPFHMYPNIEVIKGVYSRAEQLDLLKRSDCFVYPSRGEGYGLPPLEALATDMQVITVNAHGISSYFDDTAFIGVDAGTSKAKYDNPDFTGQDLGNFAEVDPNKLAQVMRQCYNDWLSNTADVSGSRANYALNHSMANYAPMFADLFINAAELMPNSKTDIPKLSIIVLTHNALEYTKKCLQSIKTNTNTEYELIIIDNASTDDTPSWLLNLAEDKADNVKIILNKENRGVAGGRNQGIKLARGHYVVFLDNDTEVSSGWDKCILDTLTLNPDVWVVGKAGSNVASLNPLTWKHLDGSIDKVEADVVAGFCFAFPRKVIEYIGNQYDGLGKFWHEDLEFCLRVKKYGKKVIRDSSIPILHHEHKSAGNNVKGDEIKAVFEGFNSKAKKVENRLIDSNILTIYREPDNSHSSYSVIADNIDDYLRDLGLVVFRKPNLLTETKSFDLCKGFELKINGRRLVVLHLENDRPPKSWLKELELVDYVLCASPHVYHSLKVSHPELLPKLINYSPDGFNHKQYYWEVEPYESNPYGNPEAFTFLQVGAAQPRKGTDILIRAFAEEFTQDEPVQLMIKNYDYGQQHFVDKYINQYPEANIINLYEDWSNEHLARMYKTISRHGAYCSPHRGEGFGIPQLEAVACGMRIGYTNWGGCVFTLMDAALSRMGDFFHYDMMPSTFHNNDLEQYYDADQKPQWAEPRIEDVKKWMRQVYEAKYEPKIAKIVSRRLTNKYSFEARANGVLEVIRKINNNENLQDNQ